MRRTPTRGFTLIELLLVFTLLGVLAAFAWPEFYGASAGEQLKESASRLRTTVTMCRAEAMNRGRRYRLEIRVDGSVRLETQVDPILAPHLYNPIQEPWARTELLMPNVWVESVQELPEGPAPIQIIDEQLAFPQMKIEPVRVDERDAPLFIDFEADGSARSVRWVLRDAGGKSLLQTLDGRLGRVTTESWELLTADEVQRPEALPAEEIEIYDAKDFER